MLEKILKTLTLEITDRTGRDALKRPHLSNGGPSRSEGEHGLDVEQRAEEQISSLAISDHHGNASNTPVVDQHRPTVEQEQLPPITVVVPTHNRPEMMTRAVRSVVDQHYEGNLEVVIVFDACDPFMPLTPDRPDRVIRTVTNERTRGLAGARNTGILSATHDLVAFLDDDDAWLPEKLHAQIELLRKHSDAVLVGTAIEVLAQDRKHTRLVGHDPVSHEHLLHDRLPGLHSSSFLFRKEALLDIGLVDEELPGSYGEDYDLLLRTAKLGPIRVVDKPHTLVTWQGQSYFFGKWSQYADALEWLLKAHPEFHASRRAVGRIESQIAFARAASGARAEGRKWARKALRHHPRQPKAMLAWAIGARLARTDWVVWAVQRAGKGI